MAGKGSISQIRKTRLAGDVIISSHCGDGNYAVWYLPWFNKRDNNKRNIKDPVKINKEKREQRD